MSLVFRQWLSTLNEWEAILSLGRSIPPTGILTNGRIKVFEIFQRTDLQRLGFQVKRGPEGCLLIALSASTPQVVKINPPFGMSERCRDCLYELSNRYCDVAILQVYIDHVTLTADDPNFNLSTLYKQVVEHLALEDPHTTQFSEGKFEPKFYQEPDNHPDEASMAVIESVARSFRDETGLSVALNSVVPPNRNRVMVFGQPGSDLQASQNWGSKLTTAPLSLAPIDSCPFPLIRADHFHSGALANLSTELASDKSALLTFSPVGFSLGKETAYCTFSAVTYIGLAAPKQGNARCLAFDLSARLDRTKDEKGWSVRDIALFDEFDCHREALLFKERQPASPET